MSPSGDRDSQGRGNRKCKGQDDLQDHNIRLNFNEHLSHGCLAPRTLNLDTNVNDVSFTHRSFTIPSIYLLACWQGPEACLDALEERKVS
jgi:hypothetical protein